MNDTTVPTPLTLDERITLLAYQQSALAVMQDEAKRIQEQREALEMQCARSRKMIGELAIATGERRPHPAVTVQHKCKPRVGYIPVKIKEDLSPWRSDGNKDTIGEEQIEWCTDCKMSPDKCGGAVGVSCVRYPLLPEYDDKNYDPVTDEL